MVRDFVFIASGFWGRVQGSEFKVWGSWFEIQGSRVKDQGLRV